MEIPVHKAICLLPGSVGVELSETEQPGLQVWQHHSLNKKSCGTLHMKSLSSELFSILCLFTIFYYFFLFFNFKNAIQSLYNKGEMLAVYGNQLYEYIMYEWGYSVLQYEV